MTAQKNLKKLEKQLNAAFPERRSVIKAMFVSYIAREHMLILGPPGTGKTMLTNYFADAVAGGSYFEQLMTKFTVPEEIFGPISFSALKQDRYERAYAGYAPDKRVWFLDEIWKSSSAILNSLLKAMQERVMLNGQSTVKMPLDIVIAASNEYPQDDSLQALFDRFSFKFWVDYLSNPKSRMKLWNNGGKPGKVTAKLTDVDLKELREQMGNVVVSHNTLDVLATITHSLADEGYFPSDRMWMKALKIAKACAVVDGRTELDSVDFRILSDMLWKQHKDRPKLASLIGNAADPYGSRAEAIVDGVRTAMKELPSIDLLKTKQKTKAEMMAIISKVSGQVTGEKDKILEVQDKAGGSLIVEETVTLVDESMKQIDLLMKSVMDHRVTNG